MADDWWKNRLRNSTEAVTPHMTVIQENALAVEGEEQLTEREKIGREVRDQLAKFFGDRLLKEKNDLNFQNQLREGIKQLLTKQGITEMVMLGSWTDQIFIDILGYGPLQQLLDDPHITEIMVTRYDKVYIEQGGKLVLQPDVRFESDKHLVSTIEKIINPLGRKITAVDPFVDARLPDGSRVNATLIDATPDGATLTIRKHSKNKPTGDDYLNKFGSLSKEMLSFLKACVEAEVNIIVSGGTGSGKTTLLNMLSNYIPHHLSIVTIEDNLELQLQQDNVRRMETRAGDSGKGEITIRTCVKNTLRMRPDIIVVGEIRSGEIVDMFRAITSGHSGLSTIHAESPRDLMDTVIPILFGMSDMTFSEMAQKKLMCSAIPIIVQIARMKDGGRKITHITYVGGVGKEGAKEIGMSDKADPNNIYLQDVFRFVETGYEGGKVQGYFEATGFVPSGVVKKIRDQGIHLDESIFAKRQAA